MAKSKASAIRPVRDTRRKTDFQQPRQRFLIVCEGKRTEPNYFARFRRPQSRLAITVRGTGLNTLDLVEKARELMQEEQYDQVWCVFDRDVFPAHHFNEAIRLAEENKLRVAYTNEAFELWYLLHFDYHDTAVSRADYRAKLKEKLGAPYEKTSPDMYDRLLERQETAIRHAQKLLASHPPECLPADCNPVTTVHLLVEQLRRFSV